MQGRNLRCKIAHMPIGTGILEYGAKYCAGIQVIWATHNHFDPQRLRTGVNHSDILWMAILINKEGV